MDRVLTLGAPTLDVSGQPTSNSPSPPPSRLAPYWERADRLAIAYGARYRAAGLFRYGLIVPATAAALIGATGGRPLQIAGNLAEFLILVFLVGFSSSRWQEPTHERFCQFPAAR